ncbi:MAG: hypothetical protein FWF18_01160 [Dehalococcoidia bacterium]|nr:hypothetical protein [Dehalococcoidia bacterium]
MVVVLGMLPACRNVDTTKLTTTAAPAPTVMPSDFYIIYENDWRSGPFRTMLDTKRKIIGKTFSPSVGDYIYTTYVIPSDDLKLIYNALVEHDIKSLSGLGDTLTEGPIISPWVDYRITFRLNGELHTIIYNNSAYASYPNLWAFSNMLYDYCANTEEYQSFPPTQNPM